MSYPPPVLEILDLAHEEQARELELKRLRVERALRARGLTFAVPAPEPSPRRWGARARIKVRPGPDGSWVVHARGSHRPVPAPLEAMARPELVHAAEALGPHAERLRGLRELELRSNGERVVAVLTGGPPPPPGLARELAGAMGPEAALCHGARGLAGDPGLEITGAGPPLRHGPLTFFQVNLEVNRSMVAHVVARVLAAAPMAILDLFGGAGNLSMPLAARGVPTILVEASAPAARDAKANAARHSLPVRVERAGASSLTPGRFFYDVLILDPPREGAGEALTSALVTRPRLVVLLSCQPPALARDLQLATERGYRLEELSLHDMFPLTSHVEAMAVLSRPT